MADIDYDKLAATIVSALTDAGIGRDAGGKTSNTRFYSTNDELISALKKTNSEFTRLSGMFSKSSRSYVDVADKLKKLDEELQESIDGQGEFVDANARLQKLNERNELARAAAINNSIVAINNFSKTIGSTLANSVTAGVSTLTRSLTSDTSGIATASQLMNVGIDAAGSAAQATGSALGTLGATAMQTGKGPIKLLGLAATGAGAALQFFGNTGSKVARFAVEVLGKELEKTATAFNQISASGAVFSDGMSGMRKAAADAGMTLTSFSAVISKNSADLAALGGGVTEGARQMGRVGKTMRESGLQAQLLNLGFSIEEQASLSAEVAAQMRGLSGTKSSDAEIAAQTGKYAENLRVIAAITGEDAKRKTEESRQQNQIMAFQNELAKKTPEQRAAIDAAMATMTEIDKKNFRDRVLFGEVINKEGAIHEATIRGAREKGEAQLALWNNGQMTAEANAKLNAQYGATIQQSIAANQEMYKAGYVVGGLVGDISKNALDSANQAKIYTDASVQNAKDAVAAQKDTTDPLTKGIITSVVAMNDMKVAIENEMIAPMKEFAKITGEVVSGVREMLASAGMGAQSGPSFTDKLKSAGSGALMGASTGSLAGPWGAGIGAAIGGIYGWFNANEGKANGGISSGPSSGYLEKLHGTELIVPMTGNTLDTESAGYSELLKIQNSIVPMLGNTLDSNSAGFSKLSAMQNSAFTSAANPVTKLMSEISSLISGSLDNTPKSQAMTSSSGENTDILTDILSTLKDQFRAQEQALRTMDETSRSFERLARAME